MYHISLQNASPLCRVTSSHLPQAGSSPPFAHAIGSPLIPDAADDALVKNRQPLLARTLPRQAAPGQRKFITRAEWADLAAAAIVPPGT